MLANALFPILDKVCNVDGVHAGRQPGLLLRALGDREQGGRNWNSRTSSTYRLRIGILGTGLDGQTFRGVGGCGVAGRGRLP